MGQAAPLGDARWRWPPSSSTARRPRRADPARFAFAHGGKDGTPFPVDRETYDRMIETLKDASGRREN
jgi:hypothetical protein